MGNKGHGRNLSRLRLAPYDDPESGPGRGESWGHEAHGDGGGQAGGEAAGGDNTNDLAVLVGDLGAFPGWRAFEHLQTNPLADRAALKFAQNADGAGEIGGLPSPDRNGEAQIGLNGADGFIYVMAIKGQAGLEPEAVPGAQTDGPYTLIRELAAPAGP